jgi:hypothetical protein
MNYKDFWMYKKHYRNIQITDLNYKQIRNSISEYLPINFSKLQRDDNSVFDWESVSVHYSFFYDFPKSEIIISDFLKRSELNGKGNVLIETQADIPVINVCKMYFIENWFDLTNSIVGMGSIVVSDDYKLLMEFTDDAKYLLHSNFSINLFQ